MREEDPVFEPWKPVPRFPSLDRDDWEETQDKWTRAVQHKLDRESSWELPISRSSFSHATPDALRWQREHLRNDERSLERRASELHSLSHAQERRSAHSSEWVRPPALPAHERVLRGLPERAAERAREAFADDDARLHFDPGHAPIKLDLQRYSGEGDWEKGVILPPSERLSDLARDLDEMRSRISSRRAASREGALNPGHRQDAKLSKALRYDWDKRKWERDDADFFPLDQAWEAAQSGRKQPDFDAYYHLEDRFYRSRGYLRSPKDVRTLQEDDLWVLPENRPGQDRPHGPRPAQKPIRLQDQARRAAEARRERLLGDLRDEENS